jgi:hypothetical protein
MITKWIKVTLIGVAGAGLVGGLLFGSDLFSYLRTSVRSAQTAVKEAVPIEFELQRAQDTLGEVIPEMHAHVRMIAQEEVELANLKTDIAQSTKALADEKERIGKLRKALDVQQATYTFGEKQFSHEQVRDDLSQRFERFKEAELVLASKGRLLTAREKSLQAAMQMLDRTKAQKQLLEDKINGLESQWRLIKASATGTSLTMDSSKLGQTEKLIAQIKKRLDVSERVLAHESQMVQEAIPLDTPNEGDLLNKIDEYFAPPKDKGAGGHAEITPEAAPRAVSTGPTASSSRM